jgi:hypothetical protein
MSPVPSSSHQNLLSEKALACIEVLDPATIDATITQKEVDRLALSQLESEQAQALVNGSLWADLWTPITPPEGIWEDSIPLQNEFNS